MKKSRFSNPLIKGYSLLVLILGTSSLVPAQNLKLFNHQYALDNVHLNISTSDLDPYENGDNYLRLLKVNNINNSIDTLLTNYDRFGSLSYAPIYDSYVLSIGLRNCDSIPNRLGISLGIVFNREWTNYFFGNKYNLFSGTPDFFIGARKNPSTGDTITDFSFGSVASRVFSLGVIPELNYNLNISKRINLQLLAAASYIVSIRNTADIDFNYLRSEGGQTKSLGLNRFYTFGTRFQTLAMEFGFRFTYRINTRFSFGVNDLVGLNYINHSKYDFWSYSNRYGGYIAYHLNAKDYKTKVKF